MTTSAKPRHKLIPSSGLLSSRLVVIGEAPGRQEHVRGKVFVGGAGQLLDKFMRLAGLAREDSYLTNVVPYWPGPRPGAVHDIDQAEMEDWTNQLHDELAELEDPKLLVVCGDVALRAVLSRSGISKWRGSVLQYEDRKGRVIKAVPVLHPAAVLRQHAWFARTLRDWRRVFKELHDPTYHIPQRTHHMRPDLAQLEDYVKQARGAEHLAVDIETPGRDTRISCIGFSIDPKVSLVVPTTLEHWGSEKRLEQAWASIRDLGALPTPKVLQNGLFDAWVLRLYGVELHNFYWDTLAMHHWLDPTESHDLAFLASIYTRQPYWKGEGRKLLSQRANVDARESFWMYCGLDATLTLEIQQALHKELKQQNRADSYLDRYPALFSACLDLSHTGFQVDQVGLRRRLLHLQLEQFRAYDALARLNDGEPLHAKAGLSPARLNKFLYTKLKLAKQRNPKTKGLTSDEVAIKRLIKRYKKFRAPGQLILNARRANKLASFLGSDTYDQDYRMRSSYVPFAETGRMRCSSTPRGTGRNAQNSHKSIRDVYIPEPGHVLLEVDLSQAEDRVVKALTGEDRLIDRARSAPGTHDEHRETALLIFRPDNPGLTLDQVTKDQRAQGKMINHATNYGMQGPRLSDAFLKHGYHKSVKECQAMIDRKMQATPEILNWQRTIRAVIMNECELTNSWGRRFNFRDVRMDDTTFKFAYSCLPQSEIGDLMNQWGFVPLWRLFRQDPAFRGYREVGNPHHSRRQVAITDQSAHVVAHMHDGLVISVQPKLAWYVADFLRQNLERPRNYQVSKGDYPVVELSIPCTYSLGSTWAMDKEWTQLPNQAEFTLEAQRLARSAK